MEENKQSPVVIAFVADLMFSTRIGKVIDHLGYEVKWVEKTADLGGDQSPTNQVGVSEQIGGQMGQLFIKVAGWQPALLIFDLSNEAIPWESWMPPLKSSPATRQIPIIAFGPHTNVDLMQRAKKAGADAVFARSRFTSDMPNLIQSYTRIPDYDSLTATCQEPLSDLARSGIEKFNERQFYPCHDDLEEAWVQDKSPGRDLYQGILQAAIAYYQIERGNYRGAMKMLLRLRQRLEPLPSICRGVNLQKLRQDVNAVQEALVSMDEGQIEDFDTSLFKPIEFA